MHLLANCLLFHDLLFFKLLACITCPPTGRDCKSGVRISHRIMPGRMPVAAPAAHSITTAALNPAPPQGGHTAARELATLPICTEGGHTKQIAPGTGQGVQFCIVVPCVKE